MALAEAPPLAVLMRVFGGQSRKALREPVGFFLGAAAGGLRCQVLWLLLRWRKAGRCGATLPVPSGCHWLGAYRRVCAWRGPNDPTRHKVPFCRLGKTGRYGRHGHRPSGGLANPQGTAAHGCRSGWLGSRRRGPSGEAPNSRDGANAENAGAIFCRHADI